MGGIDLGPGHRGVGPLRGEWGPMSRVAGHRLLGGAGLHPRCRRWTRVQAVVVLHGEKICARLLEMFLQRVRVCII